MKKIEGLGDVVELVTTTTGIKKFVKIVSEAIDKDCGCDQRRDNLNKKIPLRPRRIN